MEDNRQHASTAGRQLDLPGMQADDQLLVIGMNELTNIARRLIAEGAAEGDEEIANARASAIGNLHSELLRHATRRGHGNAMGDAPHALAKLDNEMRNRILDEARAACAANFVCADTSWSSAATEHNHGVHACLASIDALRGPSLGRTGKPARLDSSDCVRWLTSYPTEAIVLADGRVIQVGGRDVMKAATDFRVSTADLPASAAVPAAGPGSAARERLYMAAIMCGHMIDDEKVVLRRDPKVKGNALSQLADRLAAAWPGIKVPDTVHAALAKVYASVGPAHHGPDIPAGDAQCVATIRDFIATLDPAHVHRAETETIVPGTADREAISAEHHRTGLAMAREAARVAAFRDLMLLFPARRQHVANLMAHGWEITAIEMCPSTAVAQLLEGGEPSDRERYEAEAVNVRRLGGWPRKPTVNEHDGRVTSP